MAEDLRRGHLLAGLAILLLAALLRAPSLTAGQPYTNYGDEGYLLRPVAEMLRAGEWELRSYLYPTLPGTTVAAVARLYAPLHPQWHAGRTFREELTVGRLYDVVGPFALIFAGRFLSFLVGLLIVLLTGLYARRLLGAPAGLFATFLASLAPPLVLRGAIAMVDPWAALFVLACFYLAPRIALSPRPGRATLAMGLLAGLASAAKYPALLAASGAFLPVVCGERGGRERLRCLALGAVGAVAGLVLAMPAVVLHTGEVLAAILHQNRLYKMRDWTPPLWHQAVVRAEWSFSYEHPELGVTFLVLVAIGVAVGLRDRRLVQVVVGWLLSFSLCLLLYLSKSFQAFRNLLPLVPLACVAVAILFARLRERFSRPVWVDAGAVLLVAGLFGPPLTAWAWERAGLVDARVEAIDWLVAHPVPGGRALLLHELAFAPAELRRLPEPPQQSNWPRLEAALTARSALPRFLVVGQLKKSRRPAVDLAKSPLLLRSYRLRARFGEEATTVALNRWRGNRQTVYVFERAPPGPPARRLGPERRAQVE